MATVLAEAGNSVRALLAGPHASSAQVEKLREQLITKRRHT